MNKRIALAFWLVLALPWLAMADDGPAEALRAMWDHMRAGDLAAAEAIWFPVADTAFAAEQRAAMAENTAALQSGDIRVEILDSRVQGELAMVVVKYTVTMEGETTEQIQNEVMARRDGRWTYVFKELMSDETMAAYDEADFIALEEWWWSARDGYRGGP